VFRYRLHSPDGDDLGEATYAMMIKPGEEIHLGAGQSFRVLDVVPFEEEDESRIVGVLQVEAARRLSTAAPPDGAASLDQGIADDRWWDVTA
jgi:hypothetical protein